MSTLKIDTAFSSVADPPAPATPSVDVPAVTNRENPAQETKVISPIAPTRSRPVSSPAPPQAGRIARWSDKIEAFISRLSVRDNFWQRICSLIWLPYAFFSGIKMKAMDANTYAAVLPFRRFNRNWYHAMAGGALLANSEIAGGMYLFGICGSDYTVVCKQLNYTFLRPCFGPAVYKMTPRENIRDLLVNKDEFNITLDLEILQQVNRPGERDKRIGRCEAVFHITPKSHHRAKKARRQER
jgi:hypothetical protein